MHIETEHDNNLVAARRHYANRKWQLSLDAYDRENFSTLSADDRERIAFSELKLRNHDRARALLLQIVDEDSTSPYFAIRRKLLEETTDRFSARRAVASFIQDNLLEVRKLAKKWSGRRRPTGAAKVFIYWAQGLHDAPAIVRRCYDEAVAHHGPDRVVLLDDRNARHYVDLSDPAATRAPHKAHYSDLLRVAVLADYGGVWVDATCLTRGNLLARYKSELRNGFFSPRISQCRTSSWLMASAPNGYVVCMLRAALDVYWRHNQTLSSYFLLHQAYEALYHLDEEFRAAINASRFESSSAAHVLQKTMLNKYRRANFISVYETMFYHKLTYKYDHDANSRKSVVSHLVRGDFPRGDSSPVKRDAKSAKSAIGLVRQTRVQFAALGAAAAIGIDEILGGGLISTLIEAIP